MEQRLLLHLGVVAIEKGAFWSPSTKIANLALLNYQLLFNLTTTQNQSQRKRRIKSSEILKYKQIKPITYSRPEDLTKF